MNPAQLPVYLYLVFNCIIFKESVLSTKFTFWIQKTLNILQLVYTLSYEQAQ